MQLREKSLMKSPVASKLDRLQRRSRPLPFPYRKVGLIIVYFVCAFFGIAWYINYKPTPVFMEPVHNGKWRSSDMQQVPDDLKMKASQMSPREMSLTLSDGVSIHYLAVDDVTSKAHYFVLFLHGMRFTSQNWNDIGSLGIVGAMGIRAFAVDLPGYGKSDKLKSLSKADVLKEIISKLQKSDKDRPIIVSPSMSGSFSLPFLMRDTLYTNQHIGGFIPIAPVDSDKYDVAHLHEVNIPTMIVIGERDTNLGTLSSSMLRNMQNSEPLRIMDAGHACYLDKPDDWHVFLYTFLYNVAM